MPCKWFLCKSLWNRRKRIKEVFEKYITIDPYLRNTREHEFLKKVIMSVESNNEELFDDAVNFLNENGLLDNWKTHILLVIKKTFNSMVWFICIKNQWMVNILLFCKTFSQKFIILWTLNSFINLYVKL